KLDDNMDSILDQFDGVKIFLQDRFGELNEYIGILHNAMKTYIKDQTKEIVGEIENSEVRMKGYMNDNTVKIIDNAEKNLDSITQTVTTGFETMTEAFEDMTERLTVMFTTFFAELKFLLNEIINPGEANLKQNIIRNLSIMEALQKEIKIKDGSVYTDMESTEELQSW
ncbi:MAG: hypothetical protein PHI02_09425, partial [Sulfurovaceae bacterium]|nr:hypothetical protein [Sulfurovaceae bacterium]